MTNTIQRYFYLYFFLTTLPHFGWVSNLTSSLPCFSSLGWNYYYYYYYHHHHAGWMQFATICLGNLLQLINLKPQLVCYHLITINSTRNTTRFVLSSKAIWQSLSYFVFINHRHRFFFTHFRSIIFYFVINLFCFVKLFFVVVVVVVVLVRS